MQADVDWISSIMRTEIIHDTLEDSLFVFFSANSLRSPAYVSGHLKHHDKQRWPRMLMLLQIFSSSETKYHEFKNSPDHTISLRSNVFIAHASQENQNSRGLTNAHAPRVDTVRSRRDRRLPAKPSGASGRSHRYKERIARLSRREAQTSNRNDRGRGRRCRWAQMLLMLR